MQIELALFALRKIEVHTKGPEVRSPKKQVVDRMHRVSCWERV